MTYYNNENYGPATCEKLHITDLKMHTADEAVRLQLYIVENSCEASQK